MFKFLFLLFCSLGEIKIEKENRLYCINIYDDDLLFCELWVHNKNSLTFYSVQVGFYCAMQYSDSDRKCQPMTKDTTLICVSQLEVQKTLNENEVPQP